MYIYIHVTSHFQIKNKEKGKLISTCGIILKTIIPKWTMKLKGIKHLKKINLKYALENTIMSILHSSIKLNEINNHLKTYVEMIIMAYFVHYLFDTVCPRQMLPLFHHISKN